MYLKLGDTSGTSLVLTNRISLPFTSSPWPLLCSSLALLQLPSRHPSKQITKTPTCLENVQDKNFLLKGDSVPL